MLCDFSFNLQFNSIQEARAVNSPVTFPILSRRQMLFGFSALAASSVLTGCGASLYKAVSSPAAGTKVNPQPMPAGEMTAVSLAIGSGVMGTMAGDFIGLAYEKASLSMPRFTGANAEMIGMFGRLGKSVLRLGGNTVDENVWTPEGKGQTAGQIAPADVDALAAFLKATGWSCIYGVNLGGSATGATTPELAAAEIAYVSKALGGALVGVEIGNECENYIDPGSFYEFNWTVEMFEALWGQYRDAIVERTPGAPMVGPAAGSDVAGWTIPFGESVTEKKIGLVTQHYYRGPAYTATATVEDLISPDAKLVSELKLLREGAESIGVPFRMAECNSYWSGGEPGVSNAYASSLWAIDMIFQCGLGGAAGINFQGGDHGLYTVIEDNYGPVVGARPVYYGLLMAALAGEGTLLSNALNVGELNVTAYAVKAADGGMSVVVVNKDTTQNLDLSLSLPASVGSATLMEMTQLSTGATAPSLSATSGVSIQGGSVAQDGGFAPGEAYDLTVSGEQVTCYVPALSAVLIRLA
jgi:hypothetical protein